MSFIENFKPAIKILESTLFVSKAKVYPSIVEGINQGLEIAPAKYPIIHSHVKQYTLAKETNIAVLNDISLGQLPRRILVALVDNSAFIGDYKRNPFYFDHFDLNAIAAYSNGIQVPTRQYTPDYEKNLYVREMMSVFTTLRQDGTEPKIPLSRLNYMKGNVIYGFQFSPDLSSGCSGSIGHANPIEYGNLRLEMRFAKPLPKAVTVLVFAEYDRIIQIDKGRNASIDFY
jgi:hypothetical protein